MYMNELGTVILKYNVESKEVMLRNEYPMGERKEEDGSVI